MRKGKTGSRGVMTASLSAGVLNSLCSDATPLNSQKVKLYFATRPSVAWCVVCAYVLNVESVVSSE